MAAYDVRKIILAQEATPATTTEHPLVGTWLLTFPAESGMTPALSSFTADGIVLQKELDSTSSNDAWEATGEGRPRLTIIFLAGDETEAFQGVATVRGEIDVDEAGERFTGAYSVEATTTEGAVFPIGEGTVHGTRIMVEGPEAMGTPMAGLTPTDAPAAATPPA